MADPENVTESAMPVLGAPDLTAFGDRVQQPGTLIRDPRFFPQEIEREQRQQNVPTQDKPADKYAVVTLNAATDKAYQLLPADYDRKDAVILCLGNAIWLGDETSVGNTLGTNITAGFAPAVFPLFQSNPATGSLYSLRFTAKQGLYVASAGGPGSTAAVFCLVEKYRSGVPVR